MGANKGEQQRHSNCGLGPMGSTADRIGGFARSGVSSLRLATVRLGGPGAAAHGSCSRSRVLPGFCSGLLCGVVFYPLFMGWTAELFQAHPWQFWVLDVVFGFFFGLFAGVSCWLLSRPAALGAPGVPLRLGSRRVPAHQHRLRCRSPSASWPIPSTQLLPVAGIAAYTGIYGVSFLVVAGNAVLARLWQESLILLAQSRCPVSRKVSCRPSPCSPCSALLLGWFSFHALASADHPGWQTRSPSPSSRGTPWRTRSTAMNPTSGRCCRSTSG